MVGANLYGVSIEAVLELWTQRFYELSRLQRYLTLQGCSMLVLAESRVMNIERFKELKTILWNLNIHPEFRW
jgi:hypothetical protein